MKKLTQLAVLLLSTALLASCKGTQEKSEPYVFKPSLDKETACEIKVVGDYKNFEALEAEFDRFNVYYPNVELSYEKIDSYTDNIGSVLEREDKPNIFFTYASWMAGNAKYAEAVAHMEDLADPAVNLNLDAIRPGLLNKDSNGKVSMVPIYSRTYGALINKDLFEKEGIKIPTTWSGLTSACASFKDKGYKSPIMGYSLKDGNNLMNTLAYPSFVASLANNSEALAKANNLDPSAGEYMRDPLTKIKQLVDSGAIDIDECNTIEDNYNKVILRFFEGDVPMMMCDADTPSGTKKRESQSEAFIANPFSYSFYPIPLSEQGTYFIDSPSIQFSVNKNCNDLEMTNEFMRFLITKDELNNMAAIKGLMATTKEVSFDSVYAPFAQVPADRTFSPEILGVKDSLVKQLRNAAFKVGKGEITVDDAISMFGTF